MLIHIFPSPLFFINDTGLLNQNKIRYQRWKRINYNACTINYNACTLLWESTISTSWKSIFTKIGNKNILPDNKRSLFTSTTASMEFYSIHYRQNLWSNKVNPYLSISGLCISKSKFQKGGTVSWGI